MNHKLILMIHFSVNLQSQVLWQDGMTVLMDFPPQDTDCERAIHDKVGVKRTRRITRSLSKQI